jgi:malate dehydrogenase
MSLIAIVGAGPIGGALAHKLAGRNRVREVRLVDPEGRVAQGKALDILQSSPIEAFATRVTAAESVQSAAGADVIVLADAAANGAEHGGEPGLALVKQLAAYGAPIVCAGATQRDLVARAASELRLPPARVLGSAPFALESALRALTGIVADGSGVEISLRVVGVPPNAAVVAWEEATAFAQPLSTVIAPHEIQALTARMKGLWPPGPYALAAAAARIVEAIVNESRRRYSCFVSQRGRALALPVALGHEGVQRIFDPVLTPQERTALENGFND